MAYEAQYVRYEVGGHVAVITMNRPERLNAFGQVMGDELGGAWMEAMDDERVRTIVLTGEGRVFSAGRDIKEQAEHGIRGNRLADSRAKVLGFQLVPDTAKPIIAAVRGGAWGAGLYMVCGSDISVLADDATIAFSSVPTGVLGSALVPLMNGLSWLPGCEMMLRGHRFSAQRAYEVGLANHVVPSDEVLPVAMEIAHEIAALPPVHVQVTKRQLMMARPRPTAFQITIDYPQAQHSLFSLDDTTEAAAAFTEKRRPVFTGR